jgi:hypothetical protein
MLGALRNAVRSAKILQGARRMSSKASVEEEVKEMNKWRVRQFFKRPRDRPRNRPCCSP